MQSTTLQRLPCAQPLLMAPYGALEGFGFYSRAPCAPCSALAQPLLPCAAGHWAQRVIHPAADLTKEYLVLVDGAPSKAQVGGGASAGPMSQRPHRGMSHRIQGLSPAPSAAPMGHAAVGVALGAGGRSQEERIFPEFPLD
jgi:hypothetical protein